MDWGYNSRLDNILAATLDIKLKYYPAMLARRRAICMMYNEGLKKLDRNWMLKEGKIKENDYGIFPLELPIQQKNQIYQEYIVKIKDMWKFKAFMDKKGIELLIRDTTPNHKIYARFFPKNLKLPVTEELATSSVRLPTYPELRNDEVKTIISAINEFYK